MVKKCAAKAPKAAKTKKPPGAPKAPKKPKAAKAPSRGKCLPGQELEAITHMRKEKKRGAKKIASENAERRWKLTTARKVARRLKKGAPLIRKQGSGGHNKKRTADVVAKVKAALQSSEGKTGSGATKREIAKKLKESCIKVCPTTVLNIIKNDLGQNSLAQTKCQRLSGKNRLARAKVREGALKALAGGSLDLRRVVFTDETTARCSTTSINPRRRRVWIDKKIPREVAPVDLIAKPASGFSQEIMCRVCVSMIGPLPIALRDAAAKVAAGKYVEMLILGAMPNILELTDNLDAVVWQEDNATAHSAGKTRAPRQSKFA